MIRYIRLPNGRAVSVGAYVRAWRALLALDGAATVRDFGPWPEPASDVLRALRAGIHDRINRHTAAYGLGRKWAADWQRAAVQCAHAVNTPRLIVRWAPADLRARLAHRLTDGAAD